MRNSHVSTLRADRTPGTAVSAIRSWWNTYKLDEVETNDSCTEENEEESAGRRLLSMSLNQTLRTRQLLVDFDAGRPFLRLRAPLDVVKFPSILRPFWPIECEVISDIIHHIESDPPELELFYQPTGHERTPMPAGEERGKVVYCIDHATKRPYFTCSRVGGSRGPIKSATFDVSKTAFTLEFESRFESGNLQKAVQVGVYDYELTLRTDMYTKKHTQWFYFRVQNMKAGVTYRFTIINLMKRRCLYSQGMRPLLYSDREAKESSVGWRRAGFNIKYYRNQSTKDSSDTGALYSLTWTLQFPHASDTCYLAHCYPYTYSQLQHYLRRISSSPAVKSYCKLRVLCQSLAGNAVYLLTITSPGVGRVDGEPKAKKAVVVTARVHPGETNGSWMMEGFLDFLLGDSEDAQLLRDTFVFKVVPMLNPDGVVVGNYRCSLAGRDLNRYYQTALRDSFPCVWYTRNMVERLMAETDVVLYCDFHGHNRKSNAFMYGCTDASLKLHEKVFPLMMSKNARDKFSFKSCKFRVQKSKEGTGRIAMWRLGIKNSYTMEATFGGSTLGDRRGTHFTTRDLKSIGFYFCDTLLDYFDPDPTKISSCLTELAAFMRKKVRERLGKDLATDCNFSVSDLETSTSGSNSSDSDGLPVHLLNQTQTARPEQTPEKKKKKKKKHLRSRKERNRLRPERVKIDTQPRVLQSNAKHIETNLPVKERKPVGRRRKKGQMNDLVGKDPSTTPPGELSQVTLWQGCQPVKDDPLQNSKAVYLHHRETTCPHHHTDSAAAPHTGRWRCSSQLLHLSALLPPSPNVPPFNQQPPSFTSYKPPRGLPASLLGACRSPPSVSAKMFPDVVPTKRLLASFTTDKLNAQHVFRDRSTLRVSELNLALEDSSGRMWKKDEDPSVLTCVPFGKQTHRYLSPESGSSSNLFVPVLRGTDLLETFGGKRSTGVLSSLSKPSGLLKLDPPRPKSDTLARVQKKEIKQPRRGSQKSTARPAARPSQSAQY